MISQYGRNAHGSDRSGHELRTGTFDPLLPFKIGPVNERKQRWADRDLLSISDAMVAATQFNWLVMGEPVNQAMSTTELRNMWYCLPAIDRLLLGLKGT